MKAIDASPVFVVSSNCLQHPPGEYFDLMTNTRYQARLMGVTPVKMVPGNRLGRSCIGWVAAVALIGSGRNRLWIRKPHGLRSSRAVGHLGQGGPSNACGLPRPRSLADPGVVADAPPRP